MPADSFSRMDSNSSANESNGAENLSSSPGASASARQRTESESSEKMTRFVLPSVDGSPPKLMTLDEVTHVVKNIENMELVHELALNPDFKLQPYEPPPNSLERRVKEMMHKAFWDILRSELTETPPRYDQAIELLAQIKECFAEILTINNVRALEHINEVLDATVIRQQAEQGVLDFKSYADFVIKLLAKSCAPARDEAVQKLNEIVDIVDTFRGILEIMNLMKLDMANYLLDFARNEILGSSVEYEKLKFKNYLEYYKYGFPITEAWLQRNSTPEPDSAAATVAREKIFGNAYMELVDWDEQHELPEIFNMDKERVRKLIWRAKRLTVCAAMISICSAVPIISQRTENRVALAKQIEILLQDVENEAEMSKAIENVWEQIKNVINADLQKEQQPAMDADAESLLKMQLMQIAQKVAPVRQLMRKRLLAYVRLSLCAKNGLPPPPSGYADYQEELESFAAAFKRLTTYNISVFGEYFHQMLDKLHTQAEPRENTAATSSSNENNAEVLMDTTNK